MALSHPLTQKHPVLFRLALAASVAYLAWAMMGEGLPAMLSAAGLVLVMAGIPSDAREECAAQPPLPLPRLRHAIVVGLGVCAVVTALVMDVLTAAIAGASYVLASTLIEKSSFGHKQPKRPLAASFDTTRPIWASRQGRLFWVGLPFFMLAFLAFMLATGAAERAPLSLNFALGIMLAAARPFPLTGPMKWLPAGGMALLFSGYYLSL